jgi:hypothetical protein
MVSPIDAGIAGTTEFILKLQIIPEKYFFYYKHQNKI